MTFRVTDSMLESLVEQLNDISKCRYQLGHSYGRVHLEKCSMECTGISMISQGNTKKELYYQLLTLLDWISHEKRDKADYTKNCTHHDVFNIHHIEEGEKIDAGHINKYGDEIQCVTCKKTFNEKEYEENHIPKSREELRKMRVKN